MLRYGQGHIVLVALGLAAGSVAVLGSSLMPSLLVVVGAGAWSAYAGERLFVQAPEDDLHRPERTAWFRAHRRGLYAALAGAGLVLLVGLSWLPGRAQAMAGLAAFLGGVYALAPAVRRHPVGKPAAIALAWTVGGVLLPLAAQPHVFLGIGVVLYAAARAATVAANVILCDWPDRAGDAASGRQTVAVRWGARGVRASTAVLLLLALGLDVLVLRLQPGNPGRWLGLMGPLGLLAASIRLPGPGERSRILLDLLVGAGGLAVWA